MLCKNYLVAVVEAIAHWQHRLKGSRHELLVLTYHKALLCYCAPCLLSLKQARWVADLSWHRFRFSTLRVSIKCSRMLSAKIRPS